MSAEEVCLLTRPEKIALLTKKGLFHTGNSPFLFAGESNKVMIS
jgi:hypothetical protein